MAMDMEMITTQCSRREDGCRRLLMLPSDLETASNQIARPVTGGKQVESSTINTK
jgi:hypothetical protein